MRLRPLSVISQPVDAKTAPVSSQSTGSIVHDVRALRHRRPAAHARSLRRPRRPVRGGRRPEVVLVHLLPVTRSRLVQLDGGRQPRRARGPHQARPRPGLVAYRDDRAVGWVSLAPREDYERLASSKVLAPLDDTPVWSIVCFVVSRRVSRPGRRGGPPRRAIEYARAHGATTLEAYPVESRRANGSRPRTPTTARSRCSSGPGSRSSSAASGTPRQPGPADRPASALVAPVGIPRRRADYVICRGSTSSSVRVDIGFSRRVDCRPARMSRAQISLTRRRLE